jgi:hypothetical protein
MKRKKKLKRTRVTKKELSVHRKLFRRSREREHPGGILIDRERYLQSVSNIKRKLLQLATDIGFLLVNSEEAKEKERRKDLQYAREYCVYARERLGDTEFLFTDVPTETKKGKLNRPKPKKGKLNRRRETL